MACPWVMPILVCSSEHHLVTSSFNKRGNACKCILSKLYRWQIGVWQISRERGWGCGILWSVLQHLNKSEREEDGYMFIMRAKNAQQHLKKKPTHPFTQTTIVREVIKARGSSRKLTSFRFYPFNVFESMVESLGQKLFFFAGQKDDVT